MSLAREFHQLLEDQAPDWSDLYLELRLDEELTFDAARLYMAPAQMDRIRGERDRFSFRVSRTSGYGAHAPLVEACLAKLDEHGIHGELELVRVLHDVRHNQTQGPLIGPTY